MLGKRHATTASGERMSGCLLLYGGCRESMRALLASLEVPERPEYVFDSVSEAVWSCGKLWQAHVERSQSRVSESVAVAPVEGGVELISSSGRSDDHLVEEEDGGSSGYKQVLEPSEDAVDITALEAMNFEE